MASFYRNIVIKMAKATNFNSITSMCVIKLSMFWLIYLQIRTLMKITLLGPHPSKLCHNLIITPSHWNLCFAKVFAPIDLISITSTFMYVHSTCVLLAYTHDRLSWCMCSSYKLLVSFKNKIKLCISYNFLISIHKYH